MTNPQYIFFRAFKLCVFEIQKYLGYLIDNKGSGESNLSETSNALRTLPNYLDTSAWLTFTFYRFLSNAADILVSLNVCLKGSEKRDKTPIIRTEQGTQASDSSETMIEKIIWWLAHPIADASLALSTLWAIGAVLEQLQGESSKPLGSFSRKLSLAELKYSTYRQRALGYLNCSASKLVYGTTLRTRRIPIPIEPNIERLREHMLPLRLTPFKPPWNDSSFIFKDLSTGSHVFVGQDGSRKSLQRLYPGPLRVINRINERVFRIQFREQGTSHQSSNVFCIFSTYLPDDAFTSSYLKKSFEFYKYLSFRGASP